MSTALQRLVPSILALLAVDCAAPSDSHVPSDPGAVSTSLSSAPSITSQPEIAILAGSTDTASFTATADGTPAPSVQWQYATSRNGPWTDLAGATSTTLNVTAVPQPGSPFSLGNAFRAVFTSSAGTAISRPAKLVWRTQWMRDLGDDIANVPLNQLTIPGSHDMGTYGINQFSPNSLDGQVSQFNCDTDDAACVRWATAQNPSADATAHLNQGIRYFDLRICRDVSNRFFVTCHGLEGAMLSQILTQTRAWVDQHPYEVVILDFNHHFELDPNAEANEIEQAFATPTGTLLINPHYCTHNDNRSGTCADGLTLGSIAGTSGRVIVNFENDDAESSKVYVFGTTGYSAEQCAALNLLQDAAGCFHYRQPPFGTDFYDAHPLLWGRAAAQPSTFSFSNESCTRSGAVLSCYGNDPEVSTVLGRIEVGIANIGYSHDFYVQFLQTTPTTTFIEEHVTRSLDQMAQVSNPVIGPALFGCTPGTGDCLGSEFRPENLNILPINFYNDTEYTVFTDISATEAVLCLKHEPTCPLTPAEVDTIECLPATPCRYSDPVTFDLVKEVIRFDEYARTPPVIQASSAISPASTGWYNAAVLSGQGKKLHVDVTATDYRYATGITSLSCQDGAAAAQTLSGATSATSVTGGLDLSDGDHALDCTATDGATKGMVGTGNSGAGPGSTPQPVSFKVDTVAPTIVCTDTTFILHQPAATLGATVTDATSGPAAASLSAAVSTAAVGTFTASFTAYDVAGNSTTGSCSYKVTYRVSRLYDTTQLWRSGSTVPIRVELLDWFGVDVSSPTIPLTAVNVINDGTSATLTPTSNGKPTSAFTFLSTPQGYLYALSTKGYATGSYTLNFVAPNDPVTHQAPFLISGK